MSDFQQYVGMKVIYRSQSGHEYHAIIHSIPERPECCSEYPIVKLGFRNNRGKHVFKERVLPLGATSTKTMVWIYDKGEYAWKDGKFVDDNGEFPYSGSDMIK